MSEDSLGAHLWFYGNLETPQQVTRPMGKRRLAQLDYETESKDFADFVRILEGGNEDTDFRMQIFTDGSKSKHGVGAGTVTFRKPTNKSTKI